MWYKKRLAQNNNTGHYTGNNNIHNSSGVMPQNDNLPNNKIEQLENQIKELKAKIDNPVFYDIENVYPGINELRGTNGMTYLLQNPHTDPFQMTLEELLEPARQPENIISPSEINRTTPDQHMRASINNNNPAPGAGWQKYRIPNPYHPMNTPYQK